MNRFPRPRRADRRWPSACSPLFAAACGSSDDAPAGAKKMSFKLTDAGCDAARREGARRADQLRSRKRRHLEGDRARGARRGNDPRREGEPLRRPLRQLLADPGEGRIHPRCNGGDEEDGHADRQRRAARPRDSPEVEAAVAQYRDYLEQNTAELVAATKPFVAAVEAGDVDEAKIALRRRPASPTSGSSRWPSPSATSTRASTPAKTTCRRANGAAST